ncbi:helix-turn-helix domain-containing protein [Phormidesmis priestleyi]
MTHSNQPNFTPQLQHFMQLGGISTFKQLSQKSGISEKQVMRLRRGEIGQMRVETLQKLAEALGIMLSDFLAAFSQDALLHTTPVEDNFSSVQQDYQREYERLQERLTQQRQDLWQEFQQMSLQTLEPWILQWSAAVYAAQQNPQAPAVKLVPLVRPVERLLADWGIEAIAPVGAEIPYNPQEHQLMGGTAEVGALVRVRYAGYRQGDRLLYRAKVSPV